MHQRYSQIPKSECPDIWIRLPRHKWPKSWSSMCKVVDIVQGDEGPVCGVAQVVDCHGVTVGHQEREEEGEKQREVEGDGEELKERCTWMACGWNDKHVNGLEPCGV